MMAGLPEPRLFAWHARARALLLPVIIAGAGLGLAACGGDDGDSEAAAAASPTPPAPPPSGNQAPSITGNPPTSVMQGTQYTFTPSASDANGDVLTFTITNRPSWATFTTSNGRLQGTPGQGDLGTYANISISVTDGAATASLATFGIEVVATATGSATLSWVSPTQNSDGTPLTNLAGFKVYWGTTMGSYPNSATLDNPGLSSYMVDQLTPATWHFVMTSFNSQGVESSFSNVASKTIN